MYAKKSRKKEKETEEDHGDDADADLILFWFTTIFVGEDFKVRILFIYINKEKRERGKKEIS